MHTEGEGSGLLTRTRVRSDNRNPPPSAPVPLRRRLLLPVAAGTTTAVLAIIAISVWVPLHNSHAASTARAPTDTTSPPVRLREQPIRDSSQKAHQWPLSLYGVPVPGVRMPPYAQKVSYWRMYYARLQIRAELYCGRLSDSRDCGMLSTLRSRGVHLSNEKFAWHVVAVTGIGVTDKLISCHSVSQYDICESKLYPSL